MKINYAEIIEKANARKDALQRLEDSITNLRAYINEEPAELIEALHDFKMKFGQLDQEALKLVGDDPGQVLYRFACSIIAQWEYLDKEDSYRKLSPRQALDILAGE
jgi:hypothetical protein